MKRGAALLFVALTICAQGATAISPPWMTAAVKVKAALAADKHASVTLANNGNQVDINVQVGVCCSSSGRRLNQVAPPACIPNCTAATNKAKSLATLLAAALKKSQAEYSIKAVVRVTQGGNAVVPSTAPTKLSAATVMFKRAMIGNSYLNKVVLEEMEARAMCHFKPMAVQYYNDDISQADSLGTELVSHLMTEVFDLERYSLVATNSKCDGTVCMLPTYPQ